MAKQTKKMVRLGEVITCKCCGKEIVKEHTYQDYCSECSHKVMREKNTLAVRRFREKKKQQELQQKKELEQILVSAGMSDYTFYYPYPDYKFPLRI